MFIWTENKQLGQTAETSMRLSLAGDYCSCCCCLSQRTQRTMPTRRINVASIFVETLYRHYTSWLFQSIPFSKIQRLIYHTFLLILSFIFLPVTVVARIAKPAKSRQWQTKRNKIQAVNFIRTTSSTRQSKASCLLALAMAMAKAKATPATLATLHRTIAAILAHPALLSPAILCCSIAAKSYRPAGSSSIQ